MFDGIQSVDADANVLIFYPPVDAIQEFKVQTSAAPAAYRRRSIGHQRDFPFRHE